MTPETNWAGNYAYRAETIHRPRTLEDLTTIVRCARGTLAVLGSRHSFTGIGDAGALLALDGTEGAGAIAIDRDAMTATVGPSVTYAELAAALAPAGLALANLASLPHISVAGAVATASHGSGDTRGNLATQVTALELLTEEGERLTLARGDARFAGVVVGLGKLGVVLSVTLETEPAYELRQDVVDGVSWPDVFDHLDDITAAAQSVSVFHRFGERPREVWVKHDRRGGVLELLGRLGGRPAGEPRNPVPDADPANTTPQLGVPGPWSERLPHFRSGFTPSSGEEIQSEFFVARGDLPDAVERLRALHDRMAPVLLVAELRTIAADELWLSPHHGRASAGLHFTWRRRAEEVERVVREIERALAPLGARPHWGKVFTARADTVAPLYPRLDDWRALREELDPRGVFRNDWLTERLLG